LANKAFKKSLRKGGEGKKEGSERKKVGTKVF
jgi:hypothetical protein